MIMKSFDWNGRKNKIKKMAEIPLNIEENFFFFEKKKMIKKKGNASTTTTTMMATIMIIWMKMIKKGIEREIRWAPSTTTTMTPIGAIPKFFFCIEIACVNRIHRTCLCILFFFLGNLISIFVPWWRWWWKFWSQE